MSKDLPKNPLPLVLAFQVHKRVFQDVRTKEVILFDPTYYFRVERFPTRIRATIYLEFTSAHGNYLPKLRLIDMNEEIAWQWTDPKPMGTRTTLRPHQVTFHDLGLDVPHQGRYRLIAYFNDQELIERSLWFGPPSVFEDQPSNDPSTT